MPHGNEEYQNGQIRVGLDNHKQGVIEFKQIKEDLHRDAWFNKGDDKPMASLKYNNKNHQLTLSRKTTTDELNANEDDPVFTVEKDGKVVFYKPVSFDEGSTEIKSVEGHLTGDIRAEGDQNKKILSNGISSSDPAQPDEKAWFRGNLKDESNKVILNNNTGNVHFFGDVTGNVNGIVGSTKPAEIRGTTITAKSGFSGDLTGNVNGSVNGNLKGDIKSHGDLNKKILSNGISSSDPEQPDEKAWFRGNIKDENNKVILNNDTGNVHFNGSVNGNLIGDMIAEGDLNIKILSNGISSSDPEQPDEKAWFRGNIKNENNRIILNNDVDGAYFKGDVTGNVNGNATTVTNGVYTVGDQKIGGDKTFTGNIDFDCDVTANKHGKFIGNLQGDLCSSDGATIILNSGTNGTDATFTGNVNGNVSGNAGTVTDGVYTVGNQTIDGDKTFTGDIIFECDVRANSFITNDVTTGSDIRLKENISNIQNSLDTIKQIKPKNYSFKSDTNKTMKMGVIAQELNEILPNLVKPYGKDNFLSVDYTSMIGLLIAGMQEQQAQIDTLKQELDNLKNN